MRVVVVFAIVIISGCASTSVTRTGGNSYPSKPSDCSLQVISTFPKDSKYDELGIVHGKSGGSIFHGQGLDSLLPDMKEEACKLGADALVLKGSSESSYLEIYSGKRGEAEAVAIKILDH
jgi:hypothetical protein